MWSKIGEGMKMVKTKKNAYVGYVEEVGNCPDHGGNYLVLREGSKHHLFFKDDLTMVSHEVKKIKTKKNVYVGYVEEVGNCPDHGGNYLVLREGSKHHLFFEDDVTISNNTSEDVVEYKSTEIVSRDEDMEVASKTTPNAQTNTKLSDEEMITREGSRDEDMEVASKTTPNAQTNTKLSDEEMITREGSRDEDMEVASKTTPNAQTNTKLSDEEMITREGSRDEDMEVASKTTPNAQTNTKLSDEEMITREGSRDEDMEVASKTTPNAQTNTKLSDEEMITREGSRDEDMEVASKTTPNAQTNTKLSDEEMITREGSRDEDMEVASKTTPNAQTNTKLSDEEMITREDNTSEDINFAPNKFPDKEMGPTDAQRDIVFPEEDMLTQYDGPVAAVVQTVTSITAEAMIPDEAMYKGYDDLVEQVIRDEPFQEFNLWRDPFPTQTPTLTFDDAYSRGFNDGYSAAWKDITYDGGRTSNTYDGWGRGNADGVDVMRRGPRAEGTSYGSYSGRTSNTYDGWGRGNADRVDLMSRGPKAEGTGYGSYSGRTSNTYDGWERGNADGVDVMRRGPRAEGTGNQITGSYSGRTSNTYDGWERGNADGVDVISRGPRVQGTGNQMGTSVVAPRGEQYNKEDFPVDYANAKFFVIKSRGEDDVHKSIKYNFWSSTRRGNKKLGDAYDLAQKMPGGCPIFLLFSVTTSRQFVGLAEMKGPVDFKKNVGYWQQQGNWKGSFPLKWHIVKDVPNSHLRHIIVEIDGERKPVTQSRDTEKVMLEQGLEIVRIFKQHRSKTCILHDFPFYERREKKGPMTSPIVG